MQYRLALLKRRFVVIVKHWTKRCFFDFLNIIEIPNTTSFVTMQEINATD